MVNKYKFNEIQIDSGESWVKINEIDETFSEIRDNFYVSNYGRVYNTRSKRILSGRKGKWGIEIRPYRKTGGAVTKKLHTIVARAFIPNPKKYSNVSFIDNDRYNVDSRNLYWCDQSTVRTKRFNNATTDFDYSDQFIKQISALTIASDVKPCYFVGSDGNVYNSIDNIKLNPYLNPNGYLHVSLTLNSGRQKTFKIHRLVAYSFSDIPDNADKLVVNHKDSNKQNNVYTNLEFITIQENVQHGLDNLNTPVKKKLFTDEVVIFVCECISENYALTDITKAIQEYSPDIEFDKIYSFVTKIKLRSSYTNISKNYKW